MANKSLFASILGRLPKANAVNEAGGLAYKLEPKHALAQVAATGTFGNAFYSTAETQLDEVLKLIDEVDDNQYLAKLALYAREKAFMKDMPAALLVALSVRDTELMHRVFDRVVDNGRVLRTVFQMIRSGQFKNKAGKGLAKYGGGGTDCSLPLVAANQKHAKRKFAGIVLVSDNESWVGAGRHGSTGVMTAWEAFVANQRKLAGKEASPKLVNIDLQPYQTVQACDRADILNIGGFSDSVFNVIGAFLADNHQRFVAEVEAIEL